VTRCPEHPDHAWLRVLSAALVGLVLAVSVGACTPDESAPVPTPTYAGPLTATPGALSPTEPFPNEFEDREEVQVIRQTSILLDWSALMDTCDSELFIALIDPEFASTCDNAWQRNGPNSSARIGPIGFTPIDITTNADGTTEVTVCDYHPSNIYIDPETLTVKEGAAVLRKGITVITLTAVTTAERAQVEALGLEPSNFRVRNEYYQSERFTDEQCEDVQVLTQIFVDWPDTFAYQQE
jgi:hypothetical protein